MIDVSQGRRVAHAGTRRPSLRSEHADLAARAERLEWVFARLADGGVRGSEEAEVQQLFESFRRRFMDHLEAEESDGCLERAVAREPRFSRRAQELRKEHRDLRALVGAIAAILGSELATRGWARVHAGFVAFRRVLHDHERAENDVLQLAYLEDIGGRG